MKDEAAYVAELTELVDFSTWGIKNAGVLRKRDRSKRYYRGDHAVKHRDENLGNYAFNKFAQISRNRTAHIVSKKPRWRFMPVQEGALFTAEALQDIMNVVWNKMEWDEKGELSVIEARDAGTSHIQIVVRNDGFPDAIPRTADEMILDPKAKKKKHLRYWGVRYPMCIKDIERIYGKKVEPDMEIESMKIMSPNPEASFEHSSAQTAPARIFKQAKFKDGSDWLPDIMGRATVYEMWMDDKEIVNIPYRIEETIAEHDNLLMGTELDVHPYENHPKHIKDHEKFIASLDPVEDAVFIVQLSKHIEEHGVYPQTTTRKKYPFGRKSVFTKTTLLFDKPNPIAAEMKTGIDFRDLLVKWDYDYDDGYWGKQGNADLFDPQDILNHRVNSITQSINRLNHGIKKIVKGFDEKLRGNLSKFSNWIGMTIPVRHKDDITIDYGEQMPSQFFEERNWVGYFMDEVMDHTDIMSGQLPKGSPAGVTVNQLLGQGMQPINLIVKHYAEALGSVGRTAMQLMIDFVSEDVKFRIVDDKEKYGFVEWAKIKEAMGYYDIKIDVDAMLETSRQERLSMALQLLEKNVYDREQVLKNLDDPDKHEVTQRNGERQILTQNLKMMKDQNTELEGHFQHLKQNFIALSLQLEIEREKNKDGK